MDVCQIYTDVDGVYTADPRLVPNATKIAEVSYDEMLEMAALGSKVMQARSVEFAKKFKVVFEVRSSFNNNPGTIVKEETAKMEDVVIRGGENIPVVEVENLLYKHPAISAVALVGCPDERLGERVCAYVTLHDGYTELSLDDAVTFLLEHSLSRNYLPEYLEVLPALPRTPSGKIQKFKLHERAANIRIDPAKRR